MTRGVVGGAGKLSSAAPDSLRRGYDAASGSGAPHELGFWGVLGSPITVAAAPERGAPFPASVGTIGFWEQRMIGSFAGAAPS